MKKLGVVPTTLLTLCCLAATCVVVSVSFAQNLPPFPGFGSSKQPIGGAEAETQDADAKRAWLFLTYPQLSFVPEPPARGTFYSLQKIQPPLPFLPIEGLPIYSWADGNFFYDDLDYRYPLRRSDGLTRRSDGVMEMNAPGVPGGGGGGTNSGGGGWSGPGAYSYTNTTDLWLEIVPALPNFNLILHNTENRAFYSLWSSDSLLTNSWIEETYLLGALSTNQTETLIDPLGWTNLFFRAVKDVNNIQIDFPSAWLSTNVFAPAVNGGPATSMAVLVNSTNIGSAVWTNFTRIPSVTLGSTNGIYQVWFGFALADGTTNWIKREITVDTVAPIIYLVGPAPGTVSQPKIQLTGYTVEPISTLKFDVANGAGTVTNRNGYVTGQFFNTNTLKFTTNWFSCLDVTLTNGTNTITLRGTDQAGNVTVTNLTYTLSLSGDTTAPVITVDWPTNQALLSGTAFSINGQLDDGSAGIAAEIVSNGETNQFGGFVERDGKFWLAGLPLGTNGSGIKLIASDASGNKRTNSFQVLRSATTITIAPIPNDELRSPTVYLEGTVSDTNVTVYVNGLEAEMDGNSWWIYDVPITTKGTASFVVSAHPNGPGPSGGGDSLSRLDQDIPSKVELDSYVEVYSGKSTAIGGGFTTVYDAERTRAWSIGQGGAIHAKSRINGSFGTTIEEAWPDEDVSVRPNIVWEFCQINSVAQYTAPCGGEDPNCTATVLATAQRTARARISLVTGGKNAWNVVQTIRLTARVSERTPNFAYAYAPMPEYPLDATFGNLPIAPNRVKIMGQTLTPTATNAMVGELIVQVPAGSVVDVTPVTIPSHQYFYTFDVQAEDVKLELEWAAVGDNLPIDDNVNPITSQMMPGGGKRIFVGAKTPTETDYRNTVRLKIKSVPSLPNGTVYLKSFDVDDPTSPLFDRDSLIDPNGPVGNENYTNTSYVIQREGYFTNTTLTLGTNGEVEAIFTVGPQPGNNYRVAASVNSGEIGTLQVSDPSQPTFVTANDQPMAGFGGTLSPMLTVWRKLHVEVDSMLPPSGLRPEPDRHYVAPVAGNYWTTNTSPGRSTLTLGATLSATEDFYGAGYITNQGVAFEVFSHTSSNITIWHTNHQNTPPPQADLTNFIASEFVLEDDDWRSMPTPELPRTNGITLFVVGAYAPAYILVEQMPDSLNTNKFIDFENNVDPESVLGATRITPLDNAQDHDGKDSPKWWYHFVVFAHQAGTGADGEPDTETPLLGSTPKPSSFDPGIIAHKYTAIFLESCRERIQSGTPLNSTNFASKVNEYIDIILAHEMGHSPGSQTEPQDHAEEGIMTGPPLPVDNHFSPNSVKRFRTVSSWH